MQHYQPIACHLHDVYEIAIIGKQALRLQWSHDDTAHDETVLPLDLRTRDAAEWLLAETSTGEQRLVRLDWITRATPLPGRSQRR
jgi:Rho-binding antiterminator